MKLIKYALKYNIDIGDLIFKLNSYSGVDIWNQNSELSPDHLEVFDSVNWKEDEIVFRKIPEGIRGKKIALLKIPLISKRPLNIYSINKYFDELNISYELSISFSKTIKYTLSSALDCGLLDIESFEKSSFEKSIKKMGDKCASYVLNKTKENNIVIDEAFADDIISLICEFIDEEMPFNVNNGNANFSQYVRFFYPGLPFTNRVHSLPFKLCYRNMINNIGSLRNANQLIKLFYGVNPVDLTKKEIIKTLKILSNNTDEKELKQGRYSITTFYSALMLTIENKQDKHERLNNFYEEKGLKLYQPNKAQSIWAIYTPMGKK